MRKRLNLIRTRKAMGLNQEEFGRLIHAGRATIWRLENGKERGSPKTWAMLAEVTGVSARRLWKLYPAAAPPDGRER